MGELSPLSPSVLDQMRKHAQAVKDRISQAQGGFNRIELWGKNSIIPPGGSLILRILPRWDIGRKYIRDKTQKVVLNPEYKDNIIYYQAFEHWWDAPDQRVHREWCLKTVGEEIPCPICEASEEYKSSVDKDEKAIGIRIQPKETFLFNAILGKTGQRAFTEEGVPKIQCLPASSTIFTGIASLMTGGGEGEFAYGDISDTQTGRDVKLTRPSSQGDRWKVECATKPSPLYLPEEKEQWKDWISLFIDLPEMVKKQLRSYDDLFQLYYGRQNEPSTTETTPSAESDNFGVPEPPKTDYGEEWGAPAESEFSPPPKVTSPSPSKSTILPGSKLPPPPRRPLPGGKG